MAWHQAQNDNVPQRNPRVVPIPKLNAVASSNRLTTFVPMWSMAAACWSSMAPAAPGVGETVTDDGHELPRIAARPQRQLQHAIGRAVANLAIGQRWPEPIMATSSRADDKLPDA